LGGALLFVVLYVVASLERSSEMWPYGLGGYRLESSWDKCSLYPPGAPWIAILPHRTFNFFSKRYSAGSQECPSVTHFSRLEDTILTINCDQSEAEIIEQPDYISMRDDQFVLLETGMELWHNRTKAMEKAYSVPGHSRLKVTAEWFSVKCGQQEDYYVQNVVQPGLREHLASMTDEVPRLNVLTIMMDTVSRAQMYRKMGELTEFLETLNRTESVEVFQFFRLVTNGFSTEQNTKAMYTGSQLRRERSGRPYWDILRGQGYVAAYINGFCEDWMSTFLKKEFEGMNHKVFLPWCHPEYHPYDRTFGNFAGPFSILRRCIRGKKVHSYILDYVRQLWKNYGPWGKVVHIPLQEGHEGTGEVILTLDADLTAFLKELHASGELEKTVLTLTSDHGSHMGPYFMATDMGEFEQKLPLLIQVYPKWFIDKYPGFRDNLRGNEQNLVSHYDTHWTFRHLASLPEFGGKHSENQGREANSYVGLWDCAANFDYMHAVYHFKGKKWKAKIINQSVREVFRRIEACFSQLDFTFTPGPGASSVSLDLIYETNDEAVKHSDRFTVEEVITDYFALYWFDDAYSDERFRDLSRLPRPGLSEADLLKDIEAEEASWTSFKAPGHGRYLYGRSNLQYSETRTCEQLGIRVCPCVSRREQVNYLRTDG
jgi:hypothetical protein